MGESRSNESGPPAAGRAWLTRRGFLTGVVGFGAAVGLARATEGPLWHQDAFAATAPSGPPTTTLPLPATTAPEQLLLTWGADPATSVTVSWSAPFETFVFGRGIAHGHHSGHGDGRTLEGSRAG